MAQTKTQRQGCCRSYGLLVLQPGERLVVDYTPVDQWRLSGKVLAWSHYGFARFAAAETRESTLALLVACPEEQGDVLAVMPTNGII